jgi:hypothetical protein
MGRPPVKSTKALIKAKLDAETSWENTAKGQKAQLNRSFLRMIDRIDPLELIATVGLTFTVYDLIQNSNELLTKFALTEPDPDFVIPIVGQIEQLLIVLIDNKSLTPEQQTIIDSLKKPNAFLFIKSFAISYFLIKNGASILNSASGITGAIAGFIGLGVVPA